MPHIAAPSAARAELLESARGRWDALLAGAPRPGARRRPAAAPAHARHRTGRTRSRGAGCRGCRCRRGTWPPSSARGVPALAGEPIPVPVPLLAPLLVALCGELAAGGAGEAADHIREAIDERRASTPARCSTASLARDQDAIRTGAVHRGLAPDLVWLVAELAVSPFAHALQRSLFAQRRADDPLAAALAAWNHGYCPACGSWPALAEVAGGHRVLRCSFCATAWELQHVRVHLLRGRRRRLRRRAGAGRGARTDRRVEVCSACGGYLKTIDVAGAVAVSAARDRRPGDDGSGHGRDGARLRPACR